MESINHFKEKINTSILVLKPYTRIISVVLFSLILLGFLQILTLQKTKTALAITTVQSSTGTGEPTQVIVSKTGTAYYLPWCGALNRIKPENRVTFATAELARKAGYMPAKNCKGTQ